MIRARLPLLGLLGLAGCATAVPQLAPDHLAQAPPVAAPWEPALAVTATTTLEDGGGYAPVADVLRWAIDHYQARIGPQAIKRCPFHISCSHFAEHAIERHGALGLLHFIDRFLYREHGAARAYYPTYLAPDGALRIDDAALDLM